MHKILLNTIALMLMQAIMSGIWIPDSEKIVFSKNAMAANLNAPLMLNNSLLQQCFINVGLPKTFLLAENSAEVKLKIALYDFISSVPEKCFNANGGQRKRKQQLLNELNKNYLNATQYVSNFTEFSQQSKEIIRLLQKLKTKIPLELEEGNPIFGLLMLLGVHPHEIRQMFSFYQAKTNFIKNYADPAMRGSAGYHHPRNFHEIMLHSNNPEFKKHILGYLNDLDKDEIKILDLLCGNGIEAINIIQYFKSQSKKLMLYAQDAWAQNIYEGIKNAIAAGVTPNELQFILKNARPQFGGVPLSGQSMDAVVLFDCAMFGFNSDAKEDVLREALRVLGGRIFLDLSIEGENVFNALAKENDAVREISRTASTEQPARKLFFEDMPDNWIRWYFVFERINRSRMITKGCVALENKRISLEAMNPSDEAVRQYFEDRFASGQNTMLYQFPPDIKKIVPDSTPLWWRWWGHNNKAFHDAYAPLLESIPAGFMIRGKWKPDKHNFDFVLREIFKNAYCAIAARYYPELYQSLPQDYRGLIEIGFALRYHPDVFGHYQWELVITVSDNGAGERTAEIFKKNKGNTFFLMNGDGRGLIGVRETVSYYGGTFELILAKNDSEKTKAVVTIPLRSLALIDHSGFAIAPSLLNRDFCNAILLEQAI
jgi:SAM-dependent methyltransferase